MRNKNAIIQFTLLADDWWEPKRITIRPNKKFLVWFTQYKENCHYTLGYPFEVCVNHNALKYRIDKPQSSAQIAQWILLHQEFNFTANVWPNKKHANANHLLHLSNVLGNEPIYNAFLNGNLFNVDVILLEYRKLIQYLMFQTFPNYFIKKLKNRLNLKSGSYTMIEDTLYKQKKDGLLQRCMF